MRFEISRDIQRHSVVTLLGDSAEGGWTKLDTFCSAPRLALRYAAVCSADGSFETQHFMGRRAQQAEIIS